MKKLKSKKGETIVETLTAILIIALSSAIILMACVTASKMNKKVADSQTYCMMSKDNPTGVETVNIKYDGKNYQSPIKQYDDNGYCFYDGGGVP